jgi:hypothetical protein
MNYALTTAAEKRYPILAFYLGGREALGALIETLKADKLEADPSLSPLRAGEIAAGEIFGDYTRAFAQLEAEARKTGAAPDDIALYDALIEATETETVQAALVALTGTRTLLSDIR